MDNGDANPPWRQALRRMGCTPAAATNIGDVQGYRDLDDFGDLKDADVTDL